MYPPGNHPKTTLNHHTSLPVVPLLPVLGNAPVANPVQAHQVANGANPTNAITFGHVAALNPPGNHPDTTLYHPRERLVQHAALLPFEWEAGGM